MKIASVSIYKGKKGEIIIFPMWRDVNGISRDSVNFEKIAYGYTDYELGTKILNAVEASKKNEQEEPNQEVYKNASSYKSWNAFQKNFECVVIVIFDTGDWRIARYLKQKGHSYGLDKDQLDKYTKMFSEPLSPEVLGKVVLEISSYLLSLWNIRRRTLPVFVIQKMQADCINIPNMGVLKLIA